MLSIDIDKNKKRDNSSWWQFARWYKICTLRPRLSVRQHSLRGYHPRLTGAYSTSLTLRPNSSLYSELRIRPNR